MTEISFVATQVSHQLEQNYNILAFYNDDDYLFLQRLVDTGASEDDGVYLEYKDQLYAGVDIIASVDFSADCLQLTLKSPLFGLPEVDALTVNYAPLAERYQQYKQLLRSIFTDRIVEIL